MYGFTDNVKEKLPGNLEVFVQAECAVMVRPSLKAEMSVNAHTAHAGPESSGYTPGLSPVRDYPTRAFPAMIHSRLWEFVWEITPKEYTIEERHSRDAEEHTFKTVPGPSRASELLARFDDHMF